MELVLFNQVVFSPQEKRMSKVVFLDFDKGPLQEVMDMSCEL